MINLRDHMSLGAATTPLQPPCSVESRIVTPQLKVGDAVRWYAIEVNEQKTGTIRRLFVDPENGEWVALILTDLRHLTEWLPVSSLHRV